MIAAMMDPQNNRCSCAKLSNAEAQLAQFRVLFFISLGILVIILLIAVGFGIYKGAPRIRDAGRALLHRDSPPHLHLQEDEEN